MHLALALLLAATARPAEPDPGGLRRLQPRAVDATSYLANGWNTFAQNYLPLYAVDDDPATAWVEGVRGLGIGERFTWEGQPLHAARGYRIFIRSGYQKSAALFAANARPRKVKLEPLQGEVPTGKALEVELADAEGWQRIDLPTPRSVSGFRLTIESAYPGNRFEDLCISDIRVYLDGDDALDAAEEAAAEAQLRNDVADRAAAAKAGAHEAVDLAPRYVEHERQSLEAFHPPPQVPWTLSLALSVPPPAPLRSVLKRAIDAAQRYEKQRASPDLMKHAVVVTNRVPGLGARAAVLGPLARSDRSLALMLRFLALRDVAVFDSTGPERREGAEREVRGWYLLGPLDEPEALLKQASVEGPDRARLDEGFLSYSGGLAASLVTVKQTQGGRGSAGSASVYLFDWSYPGARPHLDRIWRLSVDARGLTISELAPD